MSDCSTSEIIEKIKLEEEEEEDRESKEEEEEEEIPDGIWQEGKEVKHYNLGVKEEIGECNASENERTKNDSELSRGRRAEELDETVEDPLTKPKRSEQRKEDQVKSNKGLEKVKIKLEKESCVEKNVEEQEGGGHSVGDGGRRNGQSSSDRTSSEASQSQNPSTKTTTQIKIENALYRTARGRLNKVRNRQPARGTYSSFNNLLPPRDALSCLEEVRPGCEFCAREDSSVPPVYVVEVRHNNEVIGVGRGDSEEDAKNAAVDNAIRKTVKKFLGEKSDESVVADRFIWGKRFSWSGLASYALYKMISDWQKDDPSVPSVPFESKKEEQPKEPRVQMPQAPPDANKVDPSEILLSLRPDAVPIEMGRRVKGKAKLFTFGYRIDGDIFVGQGTTNDESKQEAAKSALSHLYRICYPY